LEGLGTVAAWQRVTVRSQVEGRLDQVLFREGQEVHRGDLLARIDPRPFLTQLQQAKGALARDYAQLRASKRDLHRYRALTAGRLIAPQQVDQQRGTVGQLIGAVRVAQGAVAAARLNLAYAAIKAPIDGLAGVRLVDAGNLVRAGDQTGIVVLTQINPAAVFFTLPQDDLPAVTAAQARGPVRIEAWSRDGATLLAEGKLAVIDNEINQSTSTLRLKAELPNPHRRLWPNQFVKVRLLLEVRRGATVVPAEAVQRGSQGTFVYVVTAAQTAEARSVDVVLTTDELAVLGYGVAVGEQVVIEGQNQIRPGVRVAARVVGLLGEGNAETTGEHSGKGADLLGTR
jgi:multidrug efflux system membrane fusion protein